MNETHRKTPKHRGFKVSCPHVGRLRGRRHALIDFAASCKAGCPFYKGKDVTGVFCSFTPPSETNEGRRTNSLSRAL